MNKRLDMKLRQIERMLMSINVPSKTPGRTILPNAKIKQLKAMSEVIFQAQILINELDFSEAGLYQSDLDNLEAIRRELLFPSILICCEC